MLFSYIKRMEEDIMERKLGHFGLADFYAERRHRRRPNFLDAVDTLVNWSRVERKLRKKLGRSEENCAGVKAYPALCMFKILLLQSWYELSDQAMEEALSDRYSFSRFVGISLDEDVPDHTTICRFRNLLAEEKLLQKLLNEVNAQFAAQGKLVKTGCVVDASIISSSARPRKQVDIEMVSTDREEEDGNDCKVTVNYSKDADAAWLRKGSRCYYGYKGHMAVDSGNGFILTGHVTPANSSDTKELKRLVRSARLPAKARVYGDKGFCSQANRDTLRARKLKNGIMDKATRGHPLSPRQKQRNRQISAVRGIVERGFGTLKRCYGLYRAKYLGVLKVEAEFLLAAFAFNLKKAVSLSSA
jgi:IS5 family transposase